MATAESVKTKIRGLIDSANSTTGNTDADLTTAVDSLIAGYGSGGGGEDITGIIIDQYDTSVHAHRRFRAIGVEYLQAGMVTNIGPYLQTIELDMVRIASTTQIDGFAFRNLSSVTKITFKNKVDSIGATAFSGATNTALVVNVPWAEGAVANAPWGCTNATINYNYTGE